MTRNQVPPDKRGPGQMILGDGRGWGYGVSVVTDATEAGLPAGVYGWSGGLAGTDPGERPHGHPAHPDRVRERRTRPPRTRSSSIAGPRPRDVGPIPP